MTISGAAATTGTSAITAALIAPLMAAASVILLGALLPFTASFILDGLVILAARRRIAGVAIGVLLTLFVAIAGSVMWSIGTTAPNVAALRPGYEQTLGMLLPNTSILAIAAFAIRQLKNRTGRRRTA